MEMEKEMEMGRRDKEKGKRREREEKKETEYACQHYRRKCEFYVSIRVHICTHIW